MTSASPLKAAGGGGTRNPVAGGWGTLPRQKGGFGDGKKTIRSGAPFVFAGAGVMAVALTMGIGTFVQLPGRALAVGAAGYALGRKNTRIA